MGRSSYAFYRYGVTSELDEDLVPSEHSAVIQAVSGTFVAHRKVDPRPLDFDTFVMRVRDEVIEDYDVVIFDVAKKINFRIELPYDPKIDDVNPKEVGANDTHWTHLVMVPTLGVVGVRDGSGDRLSADSGVSRLRSIFRALTAYEFGYVRTATFQDIEKAVNNLALTAFTFDARPFNPHAAIPGDLVDNLLKAARIAKMSGKAEPAYGGTMTAAQEGMISEVVGLARAGYAQFGFTAHTKTGTEVAYKKPKMEPTKEGNLKRQAKTSVIKVLVPDDDAKASEDQHVVKTILEIYGGGDE